jgi:hypothetical protein
MPPSPAPPRACLRAGRWLLPWLSVLLVSASLAHAMDSALSSPRPAHDDQVPGLPCAALFGSYNGWLFSSGRHGPCGLGPDATTTPVPARLPWRRHWSTVTTCARASWPGRPELAGHTSPEP